MIDIEDLKRIQVQPGDVFVVQSEQGISAMEAQRLKDAWIEFIGDVPLFILSRAELVQLRPVSSADD
ncbi:hypothetical protein [Streptomyces sp. ME18-1-4]|uniref:hypothetical protein n=1 Tax=Streptomyces sp. ME18-1-4 TaxID=3028685 RepID=UPI0029ACCD28|nr:hypothetical protein [Streptomyces sp. ME18-1-4]MDX3245838.1 hypothetical protein [Streptomyces sp. ME18-1-4]